MTNTTRNQAARRVQGERWPALMTLATAAAYLDGTEAILEKQVGSGVIPGPISYAGKPMWRKEAIDNALDRLDGTAAPDWRDTAPLYHPELLPPRKKRTF